LTYKRKERQEEAIDRTSKKIYIYTVPKKERKQKVKRISE